MKHLAICLFISMSVCCAQADGLPDAAKTPGEANPLLTQDRVCAADFRTGPYRNVSARLKRQVYKSYGLRGNNRKTCPDGTEVDHLISLELGGTNTVRNLWPQSYCGQWNAHDKDKLENMLHRLVCSGDITLDEAQREISTDWIAAYRKYIGEE